MDQKPLARREATSQRFDQCPAFIECKVQSLPGRTRNVNSVKTSAQQGVKHRLGNGRIKLPVWSQWSQEGGVETSECSVQKNPSKR
ncbi:hypothetical protein GCM10011507_15880 [Edaphobacter acidisoli]|uniref:Uncharacterized protein n=1 Tax=Edaphobacter acidisoli TaxID=2040573 RepID=A0A916W3T7_9BACT|nr:hypothetical protein GCM10011507_15880 [Edaphobacter acidisoli]